MNHCHNKFAEVGETQGPLSNVRKSKMDNMPNVNKYPMRRRSYIYSSLSEYR